MQTSKLEDEMHDNKQDVQDNSLCSSGHIVIQQTCHVFVWINRLNNLNICTQFNAMPVNMKSVEIFTQVFDAVSLDNEFPPLLSENTVNSVYIFKFQRYFNKLKYRYKVVPISKGSGFYICNYKKFKNLIVAHLFVCKNGGYILSRYFCD